MVEAWGTLDIWTNIVRGKSLDIDGGTRNDPAHDIATRVRTRKTWDH